MSNKDLISLSKKYSLGIYFVLGSSNTFKAEITAPFRSLAVYSEISSCVKYLLEDLNDHKGTSYESRVLYYLARLYAQLHDFKNASKYCEQLIGLKDHIDMNDYYDGLLMYCQN